MTDEPKKVTPTTSGAADRLRRAFAADLERLTGEIQALRIDLTNWDGIDANVLNRAHAYLDHAQLERDSGRVNVAWQSLKAAKRELIDASDLHELDLKADEIVREATAKLSDGWRRGAIEAELSVRGPVPPPTTPPSPARTDADRDKLRVSVKEACRLLDEYHDNVYKKIDILRRHIVAAGAALFIALALVLAIAPETAPADANAVILDRPTVFATMLLGALGAALSGVLAPLSSDRSQRIPDASVQSYLVWVRPFVGAAAAVVVVAVLRAGFGVTVEANALPVAALAAGFSERLVGQSVAVATTALTK